MTDDTGRRDWLDEVGAAHRALDAHLTALGAGGEGDPKAPSLLPGWTWAHVLTHVARNADSFVRVLTAGRRGEQLSQYEGGASSRAADIEAGATRPWNELVDDVATSSARLDEVFAGQDRWDLSMINTSGDLVPHAELPFSRLREVLVHHADLGDPGFGAADWPAAYVREDLRRMEMRYRARQPIGSGGLPALALQAAPVQRLCWLLGRATIDGLEPAGIF